MSQINILLVSTLNYFQYLIPIIKSIKINVKINYLIHVYLINVNSEDDINKIKNLSEKIYINHINVNLDNKIKLTTSKKTELEAYSANIRINIINKLLAEDKDYILYLDVDSIVMKDFTYLKNSMEKYDLALFVIKEKEIEIKSGIILARNTEKSKIFFNIVEKYLNKFGLCIWTSDQRSLKQAYHEILNNKYPAKDKLNILKISTSYLDWNFSDNSVMWTGKGLRKYKNIKYIKEKDKYK